MARKKETPPSMWVLVEAIDSHMELVDLEITSNPNALLRKAPSSTPNPASQPTEDAQAEQGDDTAPRLPKDPAV